MSEAKPSSVILQFDIRYSAVRFLIQAIKAVSQIIKKPSHFGVVSYERRRWPRASRLIKIETIMVFVMPQRLQGTKIEIHIIPLCLRAFVAKL